MVADPSLVSRAVVAGWMLEDVLSCWSGWELLKDKPNLCLKVNEERIYLCSQLYQILWLVLEIFN